MAWAWWAEEYVSVLYKLMTVQRHFTQGGAVQEMHRCLINVKNESNNNVLATLSEISV